MNKQELYLKTIFCCMVCDGEIATEEIGMIKQLTLKTDLFASIDIEALLNGYVVEMNRDGTAFLQEYLDELSKTDLSVDEQLQIIDFAFETIEADKCIEYSEVKFFKKIRFRLRLSDEQILARYPDKEDFLLPDINVTDMPAWTDVTFSNIVLNDSFPN